MSSRTILAASVATCVLGVGGFIYLAASGKFTEVRESRQTSMKTDSYFYKNVTAPTPCAFDSFDRYEAVASAYDGMAATAADFDGDGDQDLAILLTGPTRMILCRNDMPR